jgi:putative phosphoribosyl transferase
MFERRFRDRFEAGQILAHDLAQYRGKDDVIVLGLPRGGVPVAHEVARALGAPLDVFLVRKLGLPGHEELAIGAIASGGLRIMNDAVLKQVEVSKDAVEAIAARELKELERRETAYRGDRPPLDLRDKTVILVDDGLATGSTMRAAAHAVRRFRPRKVVVAVPVAARETCDEFRGEVDDLVCSVTPEPFYAVGLWYDSFEQTTDSEVNALLAAARSGH